MISWYRAGQKSKQLNMDANPSDCSPHQQQQPEPDSSWNRKATPSRLPKPVLQQTAQPACRTRQHGDSQVRNKQSDSIRMKLSKIVLLAFQDYYRFLWTSVICFPFYNKTLIDQQFKMDRMYKCISKNVLGCDSTRLLFALSDFNTILILNRDHVL